MADIMFKLMIDPNLVVYLLYCGAGLLSMFSANDLFTYFCTVN